jgi:thymidylate synthase
MLNYKNLLFKVAEEGKPTQGRNGLTRALFGHSLQYDLADGFPMMTIRKMFLKTVVAECLWLVSGQSDTSILHKHGVRIWDQWADENGDLGPVYGVQYRHWGRQYSKLEDAIKEPDCNSRRLLASAWNVDDLDKMALPPCPFAFQLHCWGKELSMTVYQRSADMVIGVPHDIALYSLLLEMFAHISKRKARTFTLMMGDCHIYETHEHILPELEHREPMLPGVFGLRQRGQQRLTDFQLEDVALINYNSWPAIGAKASK